LELLYTSFPERDQVNWYKWEFLRRNSEYRADYRLFYKRHELWLKRKGYWYDYTKRGLWKEVDERYFYSKIAPDIVALCQKWFVGDIYPPHLRFKKEPDWDFNMARPKLPATGFFPEFKWDYAFQKNLMGLGFTGEGGMARRFGHLVLLECDLNWPMRDLLDFAKRVLVRAQENYTEGFREQQGEHFPKSRRRFEDYKTHLRVWDLKQKGKSVQEIAQIVFSQFHSDSVLQKVRDHLKSAERLIAGHYKEIR
jgi:hypothetical protein